MADNPAAQQRKKQRHLEWGEQIKLTELLPRHLPDGVFWSALENAPRSALSGYLAQKRGVRAGLSDLLIVADGRVIFVELKSPAGVPSKSQKQVFEELRSAGAQVWVARSARAVLVALSRSGLRLRGRWREPKLRAWEGPFAAWARLPVHPQVARERAAAQRRWRARQRQRAREIARRAAHPSRATLGPQPVANDAQA